MNQSGQQKRKSAIGESNLTHVQTPTYTNLNKQSESTNDFQLDLKRALYIFPRPIFSCPCMVFFSDRFPFPRGKGLGVRFLGSTHHPIH